MQTQIYDVEKIGLDYSLWIDIRTILIEAANKKVPKVKRKKVSEWLSEEALKIAKERKDIRSKGKYEEYRKLNAAFQKKVRQGKEQSIREKCRQIEELNKIGKTRDLFKEIKEMTGSRSSRGCAMQLSNGKVVSEEKEIKKRWHQYTENLYRRDINMNDNFNVHLYEDEPDVL